MSALWVRFSNWVATTGTTPAFIAFWAHAGAAFMVCIVLGVPPWAVLIYAAIKEYWFDKHYEKPPQTFRDNSQDFAGYAAGAGLAACLPFIEHARALLGHLLTS